MQICKKYLADSTQHASNIDSADDKKKIFCANLCDKVTETLLFELFQQAGPIETVEIPKSKDGRLRNYAFITYVYVSSVPYALKLFADVKLFNRKLILRNRTLNNGTQRIQKSFVKSPIGVSNKCSKSKCSSNSAYIPAAISNNFQSTTNLTSQFLTTYLFLMQKVLPHWSRLQ